ncbi:MAG: dockerin type I domain-containing protein [Planctomycetota bacterium]
MLRTLLHGCVAASAALLAAPAHGVTINTGVSVGPMVQRWGWDTKGGSSRFNTVAKASVAYNGTPANLLRAPIEPTFHNPDGTINLSQYNSDIAAIRNVLQVNPNVEVFASVKLRGGDTFPEWLGAATPDWPAGTGSIFSNPSPRPNPELYSELVANYVEMLRDEGIDIDYLGLNNETDGALGVNRYIATARMLRNELETRGVPTEYRDFQLVGPDTFGLGTAETILASVASENALDTIDIIGSHFYPQHNSGSANQWGNLADDYGKPLWHTEVHMPIGNDQYDGIREQAIRDTLSVLFASNREGVDSFVWWGYASDQNAVGQWVKAEVINTTLGATPVSTTPGFSAKSDPTGEPLYQAYVEDGRVSLWVSNPGDTLDDVAVNLDDGFLRLPGVAGPFDTNLATFRDARTGAGATITSALLPDADGQGFVIDSIPASAVGVITFNVATPGDVNIDGVIDAADVQALTTGWLSSQPVGDYNSWRRGDLDQDGTVNLSDFLILRGAMPADQHGSLAAAFAALGVPEPGTLSLVVGLLACGLRSRRQR